LKFNSLSLLDTLSFSSNLAWEVPNFSTFYTPHLAVAVRFKHNLTACCTQLSQRFAICLSQITSGYRSDSGVDRRFRDSKRGLSTLASTAFLASAAGTRILRVLAEAAAKCKEYKHTKIACNYHFFPIAFKTFNSGRYGLISALGHFAFSNAFLLQFNGLMLSASPIHSAILMWKLDVTRKISQYSVL